MFRGEKRRATVALMVTLLLALPLFVTAGSFTPAHVSDRIGVAAVGAERLCPGERTPPTEPVDALRTRDRQRTAGSTAHAPIPVLTAGVRQSAALPPAASAGVEHARPARSLPGLTAAALQVFRC